MIKNCKSLLIDGYPLLMIAMFLLPFYNFEGYNILKHSTSQLSAQLKPNASVMNVVFMLLGGAFIVDTIKSFKH